jgi:outer membrane protein, multidrug efflux system
MNVKTVIGLVGLTAFLLSGCLPKRDEYHIPDVDMPRNFENTSEAQNAEIAKGEPSAMTVPQTISRWWEHFANTELNELVEEGLANNHELKAAIARISQAEAQFVSTRADEAPEVSASGSADAQSPSGGAGTGETSDRGSIRHSYQIGILVNYEVDLWGKNRASTQAAIERAWSSLFARETVALTLTADIVRNFIQYLSFNDRLRTAEWTLETLTNMLGAVQDRMEGGEATALQVAQQRSAVADAKAVIPILKLQRETARTAIALLLGKSPSNVRIESASLSDIKFPTIHPGLPSRMLMRRPDIRQAEAELVAADADIDAARAELFPAIDLTGEVGYASRHLETLLSPQSFFFSVAAEVVQVIFDAGRRDADIKFAEARYAELVHDYQQSVYTAMKETEDGLISVRYIGEREEAQIESADAAQRAYDLSSLSYTIGGADYLTLLDTERTMYRAADELHRIKLDRFAAAVDLFKALGGGMKFDDIEIVSRQRKYEESRFHRWKYNDELPNSPDGVPTSHLPVPGFWVQMGALWSENAAWRHWRRMQGRFPKLLGELTPLIRRAPGPENEGTWASVLVGPFFDKDDADGLCAAFQAEGQGCDVLIRDSSKQVTATK